MRLKLHGVFQNIKEHLGGRLVGINPMDQLLAILIEHGFALVLISLLAMTNDIDVRVVEAILL
jgi:hypothetical protein